MPALSVNYRRHVYRQTSYIVVGVLLLAGAAYLGFDIYKRQKQTMPEPSAYAYTITQGVNTDIKYFQSSFYGDGPGTNTAYVMDLTDKIKTQFQYEFSASEEREIEYSYNVKALVRGKYLFRADDKTSSNVWSKEFSLITPVHEKKMTDSLSIKPSVEVPYAEYKALIDQIKMALILPVDGEVVVTFTARVSSDIDGARLDDTKVATVTVPIGAQIYEIEKKYDKKDSKQIIPVATQAGIDRWIKYELYAVVALGILALASIVFGFRKKIFKTPYQHDLDKIYRYHDGVIVRANRPTDLTGKRIVSVKSFDDMLNIEEELKLPIVSATVGAEATQFFIIRDDVVYVYTLGQVPPAKQGRSLEEIANSVQTESGPKKPVRPPKKVQ